MIHVACFLSTIVPLVPSCSEQQFDEERALEQATSAGPTAETPGSYEKRGPYTVKRLLNIGKGTNPGGAASRYPKGVSDPTALTLYYPENAQSGERFPLLTFGNGTFVNPTYYDELIEHVTSYGFVVIGANDSMSGSGKSMLKAIEWVIAQSETAGSPVYGKIDAEHIGAFGQSQGGVGTCNAGLDPRVDTIVPLSGVPFGNGEPFASQVKIPVFFVNSAVEDAGNRSVRNIYDRVRAPAVYGVTATGDHNSYGDVVDDPGAGIGGRAENAIQSRAGITAWFEWQLKGKAELRAMFVGDRCGYCRGSSWKTMVSKGF